ncbi:MAG: TIGR00282 family metallophosphoesterase [Thermincola sp.]|nr:TIGR00282 family metallophosphoesterase [Thermincola sp.]MDT3701643.1 TIGR00282 family metallophosphoesterase [Thermincola sp.]
MRILMIGDIVGRSGRKAVRETLTTIRQELKLDMIVANGENAAGGNGITCEIAKDLFGFGVDVITSGNHIWDKKEILSYIDREPRLLRPANYPSGTPGKGVGVYDINGCKVGIINLSGLVYMPNLDCPFRMCDELINSICHETKIILVDFHAEATSEKAALSWYLDGRASAVVGTHTHIQTADERVLPEGTAYITDIGMTGPYNSVIGVKIDLVLQKFKTQMPVRFEVAEGPYQFNAVVIEVNEETGKAISIERIFNIDYTG